MRGSEHLEEKPIAAPAGPIAQLAPGTDKMSCGMPAAYSIFRKICHVVADSETWPAQRAVARFPRNGVSATTIRHRLNLPKNGAGCNGMLPLSATLCCHWRHSRRTINPAARCNPILPFSSKRSRLPNPAVRGGAATPVGATGSKVRIV